MSEDDEFVQDIDNETETTSRTIFDVLDCVEDDEDDEQYFEDDSGSQESCGYTSDNSSNDNLSSNSEDEGTNREFSQPVTFVTYSDESQSSIIVGGEPQLDASNDGATEERSVVEQPEELKNVDLPSGWKEIYHESGVPIYLHVETNVCSLSRPYFLGAGSTKSHILPETAIPCLFYRTAMNLEEEEPPPSEPSTSNNPESDNESESTKKTNTEPTIIQRPKQEKIFNYCKRLLRFKKIKYLKFRSWDVRRSYLRTLRNERNRQKRPFTDKLLTFPIIKKNEEGKVISSKKWTINPRGKSYVAILHEYLQQSLKAQPVYKFSEVDNARTPYAATVIVNGDEYGTGVGMSKKEAKLEAAKATLLVLLPKMKKSITKICEKYKKSVDHVSIDEDELNVASVFDDIEITDPRITLLSKQTTEPTPYELLTKCMQRKCDSAEDVKVDYKIESNECTMTLGEHTVTVQCSNKRDGKQQAAQALLQAMHPYINNWGSLLRLYCNRTTDHYQFGPRNNSDEGDAEETKHRPPNVALLGTLRDRMLKIQNQDL